jgi:hypothetical protein
MPPGRCFPQERTVTAGRIVSRGCGPRRRRTDPRWWKRAVKIRERSVVRSFQKVQRREQNGRILSMIDYTAAAQRGPSSSADASETASRTSRRGLFNASGLNRAIFVKHNVRPNEREMFAHSTQLATKVFLPFDPNRLESGGRSFFLEERHYKDFLRDYFRIDTESTEPKVLSDIRILGVLRETPTLDPFVVCERLRAAGIEADPEIFSGGYAQVHEASERVFEVFRPLLEKATSRIVSQDEMTRFAKQIWDVDETTTSNPFLEALHIPRAEWVSVIFAWKALIYYDIISDKADERFNEVLVRLKGLKLLGIPRTRDSIFVQNVERAFLDTIRKLRDETSVRIRSALDKLVAAVTGEPNPGAISAALCDMAANVSEIGADVMLFDQVTSYFLYLFPAETPSADPEVLTEAIANLSDILATRSKQS